MTEKGNAGKWQLVLMIVIVVGVIVAGFLVYPKDEQQRKALLSRLGTTNHGELLARPALIQALNIQDEDGQPWHFDQQKTKWRMVLIGDAVCEDACKDLLFITRQVHLRLGKYAQRFERIYLVTEPELDPALAQEIAEQHHYMKVMYTDSEELNTWLDTMNPAVNLKGQALLVDQKGLAMMRYGAEHDGGGMLEDINHLMKYSSER